MEVVAENFHTQPVIGESLDAINVKHAYSLAICNHNGNTVDFCCVNVSSADIGQSWAAHIA